MSISGELINYGTSISQNIIYPRKKMNLIYKYWSGQAAMTITFSFIKI